MSHEMERFLFKNHYLTSLRINKSTLWYEQKRIKEEKTIKMYNKTNVRIG